MTTVDWFSISNSLIQLATTVIWVVLVRGFRDIADRWRERYEKTSAELWEVQKAYWKLQFEIEFKKEAADAQTDKASGPT